MRWFLMPFALCLPLLGCQSMPASYTRLDQPRQVGGFVDRHRAEAERLEAQGAWREALREWQIIDAVSTGDPVVDRQVRRLSGEIERGYLRHRDAARAAAKQGRYREAKRQWLAALALKPDDREAIGAMKIVEARLVYAAMPAEPEIAKGLQSEVDVYTAQRGSAAERRVAAKSPSDLVGRATGSTEQTSSTGFDLKRRAADLIAEGRYEDALIELVSLREASEADPEIDKQITKLRRVLAERHYARGVAAFREARYDEAVEEFTLTLGYDRDHHKARFYRSSAEALSKP